MSPLQDYTHKCNDGVGDVLYSSTLWFFGVKPGNQLL